MKSDKLKLFIRKIVREEVAMAINEVITELKQPVKNIPQTQPQQKIVEKKQYTKNSILNDVLNETAQTTDWQTMGEGVYDSSRVEEVAQHSLNVQPEQQTGMNQFLNKDYSAVLNKSYEKDRRR
tara:strand:- start:7045 stop:7416 length:372 start_codon:yes stop_codon:yes gene_type:complete